MLAKRYRLRKRGSFGYLYRHGQKTANRAVGLYFLRSSGLKAGFSVSNKLGKACRRNKIKRRMRAAFRELMPRIEGGYQLVMVAREAIVSMEYLAVKEHILAALATAGIIDANQKA